MPRFTSASSFSHAAPARTGLLLLQLGTPDAPRAPEVRRYLAQFLSDPRVVEIPRLVWWPILNGLILNLRPRKSAAKYAQIWSPEGSPLAVHTRAQTRLLSETLTARGLDLDVVHAMRYGDPSVADVLRDLRERNLTRLLVLPMYPQYAGSTTATGFDEVWRELAEWRNVPELRTVRSFHDQPAYIDAMAKNIQAHWDREGRPDRFVMSFHGVPRRTLELGDPYHCECLVTGRLLGERLGLSADQYVVTFQSRFGRAEWLQPYTAPTLAALGSQGVGRVDVFCPGFVADCLETLEEIALEGKESFLSAGGRDFRYIPCVNAQPAFIEALADLVQTHLAGWPVARPDAAAAAAGEVCRHARQARARALGARE